MAITDRVMEVQVIIWSWASLWMAGGTSWGFSAREHGDGLRQVLTGVLAGIKNCGTQDVCMLVCGGLNGLPDVVGAVWEKTIAPTCIVHLLRNTFTYAPRILSAAR